MGWEQKRMGRGEVSFQPRSKLLALDSSTQLPGPWGGCTNPRAPRGRRLPPALSPCQAGLCLLKATQPQPWCDNRAFDENNFSFCMYGAGQNTRTSVRSLRFPPPQREAEISSCCWMGHTPASQAHLLLPSLGQNHHFFFYSSSQPPPTPPKKTLIQLLQLLVGSSKQKRL